MTTAACLPVIVALARFLSRGVVLDGDQAVFAMQAHDAATGGFPTMGLYSWNGWNHPGPVAFYVYAPFDWLSDGAAWGTLLATGAWSMATMVLVGWLASRLRGSVGPASGEGRIDSGYRHQTFPDSLVATCLAIQLATWIAVGGVGVIDPWTPNLAASLVVPFLLAAWGMAEGDRGATYAAVILGAIAPQLHVGYSALVGVCGAAALVIGWRHKSPRVEPPSGTNEGQRLSCPTVAKATTVGVVLWLPVIVDVVTSRTGNLSELARYFRSGTPPPAGIGEGLRIMAGEISPVPTWITGPRPQGLFLEARQSSLVWLTGLVLLVGAALIRRRSSPLIIAAFALVTATISCAQLRGFRYHYLVYWRAPIILLAVVAAIGTLIVKHGRSIEAIAGVALVAALVAATWSTGRADQVTRYGDAIGDLAHQLTAQKPTGRVLLELGDGGVVGALPGILHDLQLRGADVGVQPGIEWVVGDRGIDPATADEVWFVTDNGWSFSLLTQDGRGTVIASRSPYDATSEQRVRVLQRDLAGQLRAVGRPDAIRALDSELVALALGDIAGLDAAEIGELADLNARLGGSGKRLGVVKFSPDVLPDVWWPLNAL